MTPKIEIYTAMFCGYCIRAKSLLKKKGVAFDEVNVTFKAKLRREIKERSKSHTVPQVFINGKSIGGCDELLRLEQDGKLNHLLGLQ